MRALEHALDGARRPALVVTDLDVGPLADVSVQAVGAEVPDARVRTLVLVVEDVVALRRAVSRLGDVGKARVVGCVVLDADRALTLRPQPAWPALTDLDARLVDGAAVTTVELAARADARAVLVALARDAALPVSTGNAGVWTAGAATPPADPLFATLYAVDAECPPSVVTGVDGPLAESAVIAAAPLAVSDTVEPIDEAVFNPCGLRRQWTRGMVDLPAGTRPTAALVASLRDAQGATTSDPALAAALEMSAVPLVAIDDPDARHRHALATSRAAMHRHATFAWRARLADAAGVRHAGLDAGVVCSTDDAGLVAALLLARRWSGADLVVVPDDPAVPTECFVATTPAGPPAGATARRADGALAGGLVYLTSGAS